MDNALIIYLPTQKKNNKDIMFYVLNGVIVLVLQLHKVVIYGNVLVVRSAS